MKIKILAAILVLGNLSLSSFSDTKTISSPSNSNKDQVQSEGEKIMDKLDCATCHKIDKKIIGPSYLDIAKKYPMNNKNISYLSDKIINGGSGAWGPVPMSAHLSVKKDDAKKIAKYILSLKK